MILPTFLLFVVGVLGAADILFFHTLAQRLHAHPPARAELFTHFLRGPTYALLFVGVPNFRFEGAWFAMLMGVFAFDLCISAADFWLEPESRRGRGGLPRGEYLLHVSIAMVFGALVLATWSEGAGGWEEATRLAWVEEGAPVALRVALAVMAPLVLASGLRDLAASRRLARVG